MLILLHPGFHKTGTSSLQGGAQAQMERLRGHLQLRITADLPLSARAARRFAARPERINLTRFAEALAQELAGVDPDGPRVLLISSEDLCGTLPGLRGVVDYDAVPSLMNVAVAVLTARYGSAARITLWFTTRGRERWLRSIWYQNLRARRLTEDFDAFRPRLARAAEHDRVVGLTRDRLNGRARVVATPIEVCGAQALGPLGTALTLLELPQEGLAPLPARNTQPEGAAEELLLLNRSEMTDDAVVAAKRAVLRRYRKAGETRRVPAERTPR